MNVKLTIKKHLFVSDML